MDAVRLGPDPCEVGGHAGENGRSRGAVPAPLSPFPRAVGGCSASRLRSLGFGLGLGLTPPPPAWPWPCGLLRPRLGDLGRRRGQLERRRVVLDADVDLAAVRQLAEQQLLGERLLDLVLDQPRHRPRAHQLVVAALGQPGARVRIELDVHVLLGQLQLELEDELVDHPADRLGAEVVERHDRIEPVAELGREHLLDRLLARFVLGASSRSRSPACAMSAAPALVVMISTTLRKSTVLPWWSVSLPWSITCSRMLNRSGCAFSISSSSSTQCGCWSIASVSRPPWS